MKYENIIAIVVMSILFSGCGGIDTPNSINPIGGEMLMDIDGDSIKKTLLDANLPGVTEDTTVYGYKAYKIPYVTTDEKGNSVSASGLMVIPTGMPDLVYQIGLSMVSDDHGTIMADYEAPTVSAMQNSSPEGSAVILTSLAGFITLQPDYVGFGDSRESYHPYMLKKSLANASIDFIIQAQKFANENNIKLNGQLFLTGYSEGGYASMATIKAIEERTNIKVAMSAPMAGPYDLNSTAFGILSQSNISAPSFIADIGYAYGVTYNENMEDIFNEPYASTVDELFSGVYNRKEVDSKLTTTVTGNYGLYKPSFVNDFFSNSDNWFRKAVLVNSIDKWAAKTPIRLVHCKGDDIIPYAISELTEKKMKMAGAKDVSLIPVESTLGINREMGHLSCAIFAYGLTAKMFSKVRKNTMKY
ncbi:Lysophospholipase [hydrothermal vent metagenome]|uniref:Lysophospholipase n=1 Tax=hydrothermal vent metagenome TaxID=652676 RepID=A0A1W1BET2_9ZZZZ